MPKKENIHWQSIIGRIRTGKKNNMMRFITGIRYGTGTDGFGLTFIGITVSFNASPAFLAVLRIRIRGFFILRIRDDFFPDPGSRILTTSQIQYIFKILPLKMAKARKN
jgi:hypothetical protein